MIRAHASALVLVNWRGVFYERYLLDRHVTSLEGANGAGKTTVMIAAYVVLLPDMSRLRFTNLGETAATGGDRGLWGRLGELGRPSYAALQLDLGPGQKIVIGVHLERKTEPTIEPKPFLVTGAAAAVALSDLFLIKHEHEEAIATLEELSGNAERLGGQIQIFRSTKDYFSELFERGVFALRLTTDEDKNKLNEMLRTSMTGGISRALTTELRSFLLREESGLSDALTRMRKNLDTCRRTRAEVVEAQRLEREIRGVYEAAHGTLRIALAAARAELSELRAGAEQSAREERAAENVVRELEQTLEVASEVQRTVELDLQRAQELAVRARNAMQRAEGARALGTRLEELEAERERLMINLESACRVRDERTRARENARALSEASRQSLARAASGLARHQAGLDELHRRAHAHRAARQSLARARDLLGRAEFDASHELSRVRTRIVELDRARVQRSRELESVALRRADFERAFEALTSLAPDVAPQEAFERARAELGRSLELEHTAAQVETLERELRERTRSALERAALTERARALGVDISAEQGPSTLTDAWNAAERDASGREVALRDTERGAADALERERALELRTNTLVSLAARKAELDARLGRVSAVVGEPIADAAALERVKERLFREREALRRRTSELELERDRALDLANRLEAMRGALPGELLSLADELDAELALTRFEDLEPEAARDLEAALGPLCDALVVEDPARAAQLLAGRPRELAEVWLVTPERLRADAEHASIAAGTDVIVEPRPGMVRISRKSDTPKLGRTARALKAEACRERAAELGRELEEVTQRLLALEAALREAERVVAPDAAEPFSDVGAELRASREALDSARSERARLERDALALRSALHGARERARALAALLAESHVLAEPTGAAGGPSIELRLETARRARAELEQGARARRLLASSIEALRAPPPDSTSLGRLESELRDLEAERDAAFRAGEALEDVIRHADALAFEDAEKALEAQASIAPALEAQHDLSVRELAQAQLAQEQAEQSWEEATKNVHAAEAQRMALDASVQRLRDELGASSSNLDPDAIAAAEPARLAALSERIDALTAEERRLNGDLVLLRDRLERSRRTLADAVAASARARETAAPLEASWRALRDRAEAAGVSCAGLEDSDAILRPSSELWADCRGKRELMLERLARARGGAELARGLRERPNAHAERAVEARFEEWLAVREFLLRCLPTVAGASDSLTSIEGLGRHLALLEERLNRQESELRGTSEDVARSIDVQVRRAQSQVRRLNQHLTGVRFGSIRAIRIRIARVERMDQVLKALREGGTQQLLFQPDLPIEEALNEIFRRYAGGKSGGQRLLDYREYLELGVEVARRDDGEFEPVSPTRLSTGEAIGVGAALMMMVLTEWERDANLLRGKRPIGSLRFLFLDEANRLSQDNLAVLFDLCESLDLQLLIAAPEVARADGNTTYRLVRRTDEHGKDEVIVSGRRGLPRTETDAPADEPSSGTHLPPTLTDLHETV